MNQMKKWLSALTACFLISGVPVLAADMPLLDKQNHFAYFNGTEGYFYPDEQLSRAEAAAVLSRLTIDEEGEPLFSDETDYPISFWDVKETEWYAPPIGFMTETGLFSGYDDGSFRPDDSIKRAEFAALMMRLEPAPSSVSPHSFYDIPSGHWAEAQISAAVELGFIKGYDDGSFRPEDPVTRAESVTLLNRLLQRKPDVKTIEKQENIRLFTDLSPNHWAYHEIFEATAPHTYRHMESEEEWTKVWDIPNNPGKLDFVSNSFRFLTPELKTNGILYPLDLTRIDTIALHHMEHPTAGFRDVEAWHLERGFDAIGYNFFVDFDGTVSVGRGWNKAAAVANQNGHILSIGFQGDYENTNKTMPKAQFETGVELIKWIQARVPTAKEIGGHGDFGASDCPGNYFPLDQMVHEAKK